MCCVDGCDSLNLGLSSTRSCSSMLSRMVYLVFFLTLVCLLLNNKQGVQTLSNTEVSPGFRVGSEKSDSVCHLLQQQMKVQLMDRMKTMSMKLVRMTYSTLHSDTQKQLALNRTCLEQGVDWPPFSLNKLLVTEMIHSVKYPIRQQVFIFMSTVEVFILIQLLCGTKSGYL